MNEAFFQSLKLSQSIDIEHLSERTIAVKSYNPITIDRYGEIRKKRKENDLTPVLSTAVSLRADLDCEEGVLVPREKSGDLWVAVYPPTLGEGGWIYLTSLAGRVMLIRSLVQDKLLTSQDLFPLHFF